MENKAISYLEVEDMQETINLLQQQINESAVKWWLTDSPPSLKTVHDWLFAIKESYVFDTSKDFPIFDYVMPEEPMPVTFEMNKGYVTGVPIMMSKDQIYKTFHIECPC